MLSTLLSIFNELYCSSNPHSQIFLPNHKLCAMFERTNPDKNCEQVHIIQTVSRCLATAAGARFEFWQQTMDSHPIRPSFSSHIEDMS